MLQLSAKNQCMHASGHVINGEMNQLTYGPAEI